jgi:hypothetical protein
MRDTKLGIRQKQVLETMHRNGGEWPAHWWVKYDMRDMFRRLMRRGLIRRRSDGGYEVVRR